ncbi:MAG: putative phage abortive infection protein [Cyclobacteriaceae bacterium]
MFSNFGSFISGLFGVLTIIFIHLTYQLAQQTNKTSTHTFELTRRDSVDNTFFNLLKAHQTIVSHLHERITDQLIKEYEELNSAAANKYPDRNDKDFLELLYRILNLEYQNENDKTTILSFYTKQEWVMGHYFRSLLYFINWVHQNNELTVDRKKFYVGFIQAQLTSDEMRLVFYYVISRPDESQKKAISTFLNDYAFFSTVKGSLIFQTNEADWKYYLSIIKQTA